MNANPDVYSEANPFADKLADLAARARGAQRCQNPGCNVLLPVSPGQIQRWCSKDCKVICKKIESAARKQARRDM